MTKVYGVTANGEISECRAKDPAHCSYHVGHAVSMGEAQKIADQFNDAIIQKQAKMAASGYFNTPYEVIAAQNFIADAINQVYDKPCSYDHLIGEGAEHRYLHLDADSFDEFEPKTIATALQKYHIPENELKNAIFEVYYDQIYEEMRYEKDGILVKEYEEEYGRSFKEDDENGECDNITNFIADTFTDEYPDEEHEMRFFDKHYDEIAREIRRSIHKSLPEQGVFLKVCNEIERPDEMLEAALCGLEDKEEITKGDLFANKIALELVRKKR